MMMFGFVVLRFVIGGNAMRPFRRAGSQQGNREAPKDQRDPLEIVRVRYARGELDHDELEHYLDNLVVDERPRRSVGDPPGVLM